MRHPLAALALALLIAAPADAQRRRDDGWFARKGDAALTFSLDALTPGPVEGGVGGRLWLSDRLAAAASLGFGLARLDGGFGTDAEAFSTSFTFGVERHVGRSRRVSPFLGAVAQVGHAEVTYDEVFVYYPTYPCVPEEPCPVPGYPEVYPYTRDVRETRLGAAGLLGAEVRVVEGVTLMVAHRLGLTYVRGDASAAPLIPPCERCEGGGDFGYPADYRRVEVGTGTTALTLSLYF